MFISATARFERQNPRPSDARFFSDLAKRQRHWVDALSRGRVWGVGLRRIGRRIGRVPRCRRHIGWGPAGVGRVVCASERLGTRVGVRGCSCGATEFPTRKGNMYGERILKKREKRKKKHQGSSFCDRYLIHIHLLGVPRRGTCAKPLEHGHLPFWEDFLG